jgi:hypothetical protein
VRREFGYIDVEVLTMNKRSAMNIQRLSILLVPFLLSVSSAQELDCEVTVNLERIPSAVRDNLRSFADDVRRYVNDTRWTTEDLGGERIKCTINIFFQSGPQEGRYTAQAFIGSQRPVYIGNDKSDRASQIIRVLDDRWEFTYVPNQRMLQDDFQFDALTDFLDYYAYLIIGLDLETYTELSGTRYFHKAQNICSQAMSTAFGKDWQQTGATYSRSGLVDELLNAKYQPFRFSFFSYHFDGLDLLATEPAKGLETMLAAVEAIGELRSKQDPRSMLIKTFFDAKYMEIAEAFQQYPDRNVYRRFSTADPAHQSTYDEYGARF